jgi:hypothetical protein
MTQTFNDTAISKSDAQELSADQRDWLSSAPIFPEQLSVIGANKSISNYLILERDHRGCINGLGNRMGYKGFVLKVLDTETDEELAAKICIASDYDGERTEFDELQLTNKLRDAGNLFVAPLRAGRVDRFPEMPGPQEKFVCFVSKWIEGETVRTVAEHCETGTGISLDPMFICTVIRETLRAVHFLKSRNLKHDDLHWDNIMIRKRDEGLILSDKEEQEREVSIIDMGSLKPIEKETRKSKDDDLYLLTLIINLYNATLHNRKLATENPRFMSKLRKFALDLADEDHLRFYADDHAKTSVIDDLQQSIGQADGLSDNKNFHPFEAISAEHLTDDNVLLDLFVGTLPWFEEAFAQKPLVLTGPRGCGKSMLFRYMAAKTHSASLPTSSLEHIPTYLGIYISCATHLQNSLMWLARKEGRVEENAAAIVTFFNLIVIREFLRAVENAHMNSHAKNHFGLNDIGIEKLIEYIKSHFSVAIQTPRLSAKSQASHFADDIDRVRVRLQSDLLYQRTPHILLTETLIGDITNHLKECLPKLHKSGIVFLLDDYSTSRVHPDIQALLNRIIFERRDSHYFKVSCEKFGFTGKDIDQIRIDEAREYESIDAGDQAIFEMDEPTKRHFISSLIDRRLETAEWKGRALSLIGTSREYANDVELAKFIRSEGSHTGKRYYYYGIEHLGHLWSGDIATILQVVRGMFIRAKVDDHTETIISPKIQHESIVQVSKAFRERIAGYYPYGDQMVRILNEFGLMAKEILVKGSLTSDGTPRRLYRIEMTKEEQLPFITLLENKSTEVSKVACELLRRAVFIQYSDSRGKEGSGTQTVRLELRKIFLPSFGLSLVRNSYIDVKTLDEFMLLFVDPGKFHSIQTAKYKQNSNMNLFEDTEEL